MGIILQQYAVGPQIWCCKDCGAHLASNNDHISDSFQGRHGRAKLFGKALNMRGRPPERVSLMTGVFVVQYTHCWVCDQYIGWAYVKASRASETYKEGKFILETASIELIDDPLASARL